MSQKPSSMSRMENFDCYLKKRAADTQQAKLVSLEEYLLMVEFLKTRQIVGCSPADVRNIRKKIRRNKMILKEEDGKDIILMSKKRDDRQLSERYGAYRRFLPITEIQDVIIDFVHPDKGKIETYLELNKDFFIPRSVVSAFIDIVGRTFQKPINLKFMECLKIDVINVSSAGKLVHCYDVQTNFSFALFNTNSIDVNEIAEEISESVVSLFGLPQTIISNLQWNLVEVLNDIWASKIFNGGVQPSGDSLLPFLKEKTERRSLQKILLKLNTTEENGRISPYEQALARKPCVPASLYGTPQDGGQTMNDTLNASDLEDEDGIDDDVFAVALNSTAYHGVECRRLVDVQFRDGNRLSSIASATTNQTTRNIAGQVLPLPIVKSTEEVDARLLTLCEQDISSKISKVLTKNFVTKKIGEGSFGEVFMKEENGEKSVIKIIPIGSEEGKTKKEVLIAEIAINKASVCSGKYPIFLRRLWSEWAESNDSYNVDPEIYKSNQEYVVMELCHGGDMLEAAVKKFYTMTNIVSAIKQLVLTLAAVEDSIEFEHRDLHMGNVLAGHDPNKPILEFDVCGDVYKVPSNGWVITIIDFTLSRLQSEDCVIFTDLSKEMTLFDGGRTMTRLMQAVREDNGNDWKTFNPQSNVRWILFLLRELIKRCEHTVKLKGLLTRLERYKSCYQMLPHFDEIFDMTKK